MKNQLCWTADDIKNLKLNSRKVNEVILSNSISMVDRLHYHIYLLKKDEISAETRQLLEDILAPDYEVYNHFVAKFRQTLDTFTATRMEEELAELDRWS